MTAFPDVIGERESFTPQFTTRQNIAGQNSFQRFRKSARPRYVIDLAWQFLADVDALSFESLIVATLGAATQFDWFDWVTFDWLWIPIGIGNGVTTVWTLPAKSTSNQLFFTGTGTSVSGSISAGTGAQGEDRVTISPAVASGVALWFNFLGRRRFTVQFESDDQPLSRMLDPDGYWTYASRLIQVK